MTVARAPRWRLFVLALAGCLAVAVGGFATSTATAVSPTAPVRMVLTDITSDFVVPFTPGSGAAPRVLVQAVGTTKPQPPNSVFKLHLEFYDSSGNSAAFAKDTTLSLTSPSGTLSPSTYLVLKGHTSADVSTGLITAANQVSVTVQVANGPSKGLSTSSSDGSLTFIDGSLIPDQRFDVVSELHPSVSVGPNGSTGIGGDSADSCANATPSHPVCGIFSLPSGVSSGVVMSLGACDETYAFCGSSTGAVVQALADLSGLDRATTPPATLVVKCDKTLCGGGAIQNLHLQFSQVGNGNLDHTAPACPAKNTVGTDQPACVDYVQSKRDGSGDTHLYLLFYRDMRTSVG